MKSGTRGRRMGFLRISVVGVVDRLSEGVPVVRRSLIHGNYIPSISTPISSLIYRLEDTRIVIMSVNGDLEDPRMVIWFDIDNTLYSASTKISHEMGKRIHAYFVSLGLDEDEASELHHKYYTQYGLALRGLARHHDIDPLGFDQKCDGTLPLEECIKPDPKLRKLLEDLDRTKVRVWALTNAYKNHANRVLKILNVQDQIEGLVYCDYEQPNFTCKPEPEYFRNAMRVANISDPSKCLFIDDSKLNVIAAKQLGWARCAHFHETGLDVVEGGKKKTLGVDGDSTAGAEGIAVISDLEELRMVWPDIFSS